MSTRRRRRCRRRSPAGADLPTHRPTASARRQLGARREAVGQRVGAVHRAREVELERAELAGAEARLGGEAGVGG